jgi:hypothetical protein
MSPPRDWMQDSQNFHDFMMTEVVNSHVPNAVSDIDFTNFQTNQDPNFDVNDVKSIVNESIGAIEIDEEIQPMELNFELYTT